MNAFHAAGWYGYLGGNQAPGLDFWLSFCIVCNKTTFKSFGFTKLMHTFVRGQCVVQDNSYTVQRLYAKELLRPDLNGRRSSFVRERYPISGR